MQMNLNQMSMTIFEPKSGSNTTHNFVFTVQLIQQHKKEMIITGRKLFFF